MWPNPQETANLVIITEEILNGKLHFLGSVLIKYPYAAWASMTQILSEIVMLIRGTS